MKECTDVTYFKRRDSQLDLDLTSERVFDTLPRFDVPAWHGDRAWHHPLCGLPLFREHCRLLKDEDRHACKRVSILSHATLSLESLAAEPLSMLTSNIEFQKISDVNLFVLSTSFKLILLAGIANTLGQHIADISARHMLVPWLAAMDILPVHAKP